MLVFDGRTADDVWRAAVDAFRVGSGKAQDSRAGHTEELLQAAFVIRDPRQRWTVSRNPAISIGFAIVDVIWILRGRNDSQFVNYWYRELRNFAGKGPTYHGAYGYRLRRHFGLDQLSRAYHALRNKAESRQVVLQIWDSRIDLPRKSGAERSTDIPCNLVSLLKVRDGKLHWTQILRSNDMYRGVPYNFIQFTFLQEIMAGWLTLEVGTYTQLSDSLHIYDNTRKYVYSSGKIAFEKSRDDLRLPKAESDVVVKQLESAISVFANHSTTRDSLSNFVREASMPPAYANLLYCLAAEGARRRGWQDLAHTLAEQCASPVLRLLWRRWANRVRPGTYK